MSDKKQLSDYTEKEFLAFVNKIFNPIGTTEEEDTILIDEFKRLTEHPAGSDVIFYPPDGREDSPEGVVQEVKAWRARQGKSGFKPA